MTNRVFAVPENHWLKIKESKIPGPWQWTKKNMEMGIIPIVDYAFVIVLEDWEKSLQ